MGDQLEVIWEARGWHLFVDQPPPGCVPVVKEFYSNMAPGSFSSTVRGVLVQFSPRIINRLYDLPTVDEDAYKTNLDTIDHLVVSEFLCPTGTQWKYETGFPRSFPKRNMSGMGKVWLHFVSARLFPATHLDDVTKERAYMVYTILTGGLFDVGYRIATEMEKLVTGTDGATRRGLWFPSLITVLCQRAGVPMGSEEGKCPPKGVLNRSLIMRISAAVFPDVEIENVQPPLPAFARPPVVPPSSSQRITLEELSRRQSETVAYMHSSFTSMDSVMRGIAEHLQIDLGFYRGLPPRPDWSFDEDDEDDDEDDEEDDDSDAA